MKPTRFALASVWIIGLTAGTSLVVGPVPPATAASANIELDTTTSSHSTVVSGPLVSITKGSTSLRVTLPESVSDDEFTTHRWTDGASTGSYTIAGNVATVPLTSNSWSAWRGGSRFTFSLTSTDAAKGPADNGDVLTVSFPVVVSGEPAVSPTVISLASAPREEHVALSLEHEISGVAAGDDLSLEAPAEFWTTSSDGSDLDTVESDAESVTISDDGSLATAVLGPPSRFAEATSPGGTSSLVVWAADDAESPTRSVSVTMPLAYDKPEPDVSRIAGSDRYAVAAAVSETAYPDGASVAYIAAGTAFPDALSAAPAAAWEGGPLLLTLPGRLPAPIRDELVRLSPDRIVVVGGTAAVSETVFSQLSHLAPEIDRIAGANRFEVSRNVARYAFGADGAPTAFFATGSSFPDALSASAAAGAIGAPVVLVRGNADLIDEPTWDLIMELEIGEPIIAGGYASISAGIEEELDILATPGDVVRLAGSNRYVTSLAIARYVFDSTESVVIASGANFPDALAGAAWAGAVGSPLYLSPGSCLPDGMTADLGRYAEESVTVLGGTRSLSPAVETFTPCGWGDYPEAND